jgi:hypothetical protein
MSGSRLSCGTWRAERSPGGFLRVFARLACVAALTAFASPAVAQAGYGARPLATTSLAGVGQTEVPATEPIPTGRKGLQPVPGRERPAEGNPNDIGLHVAFCPRTGAASSVRARLSGTSEAGWPAKECLKMDKGPAGRQHTLVGQKGVHNWLLGGYGNDTIIGGDIGDVIWADYHPSGEPAFQKAIIRAGNGRNVIYANDTVNEVWTGTNPRTVVHAHAFGIRGTIHCQSPGVVVFLSTVSEKHFKLLGCRHISHYSVGY